MEETIYYDVDKCKYFVQRDTKRYLSSVSDVLNRYVFHFTDDHLRKAAEKKARATKKSVDEVLDYWSTLHQEGIDKGNEIHRELTGTITDVKTPGTGINEYKYVNPYTLPDGEYSELRVFSSKYLISARIDKVKFYTQGNIRYADITDYKTGMFYDYKVNDYGDPYRMKQFMRAIPDSPVGKAIVQLNCYTYLLQLHGFTVQNINVMHARDIMESPQSKLLRLVNEGVFQGGTTFDIYQCPYIPKETYLLFSNNRNLFYDAHETENASHGQFAEIWSR
jgi:hypothetical protein